MPSVWMLARTADPPEKCGNCAAVIPAGELKLEVRLTGISGPPRLRCLTCGQWHLPLTDDAIALAQQAAVDDQERRALREEGQESEPSPVVRFTRSKPVQSFASMRESAASLFDSKAAQLNERDR